MPPPRPPSSQTPRMRIRIDVAIEASSAASDPSTIVPPPQNPLQLAHQRQIALARSKRDTAAASSLVTATKHELLLKSLCCVDEYQLGYSRDITHCLQPGLALYQYLAPSLERLHSGPLVTNDVNTLVSRLKMRIPDTLINTSTGTVLIVNDQDGYIVQKSSFTARQVIARMTCDVPSTNTIAGTEKNGTVAGTTTNPDLNAPAGGAASTDEKDQQQPSSNTNNPLLSPPLNNDDADSSSLFLPLDDLPVSQPYICSLVKTPGSGPGQNETSLLSAIDVAALIESKLDEDSAGGGGGAYAIQKLIRPAGSHVSLLRCKWRPGREATLGSGSVYTITNQVRIDAIRESLPQRLLVQPGSQFANETLTVVKLSGTAATEILRLSGAVARHLERALHIRFEEIVCDYVKDHFGLYVFLQVKAFRLVNYGAPIQVRGHSKGMHLIGTMGRNGSGGGSGASNNASTSGGASSDRAASNGGTSTSILQPRKTRSLIATTLRQSRCTCCKRFLPLPDLRYQMTSTMMREVKRYLETHGRGICGSGGSSGQNGAGIENHNASSTTTVSPADALLRMMQRGHSSALGSSDTNSTGSPSPSSTNIFASPDTTSDPGPWSVCAACSEVHTAIQTLRKIGRKYAEMIGVPSSGNSGSTTSGNTGGNGQQQKKSSGAGSNVIDEAEDGYRLGVRSKSAAGSKSILAQSSVVPRTKSTIISSSMNASTTTNNRPSSSPSTSSPSLDPELLYSNTPTPYGGSLSIKFEHIEVSPETRPPLQLKVARLMVYLDALEGVVERLSNGNNNDDNNEIIGGDVMFDLFERETRAEFVMKSKVDVRDLNDMNTTSSQEDSSSPSTSASILFLNRLVIFYFFASDTLSFQRFLSRTLTLHLTLRLKNRLTDKITLKAAGRCEVSLKQLGHPLVFTQNYVTPFLRSNTNTSGQDVASGGGGGIGQMMLPKIRCTLGAVLGETIDTALVNMRPYAGGGGSNGNANGSASPSHVTGVFIPDSERFYTMTPMPIEWLDALPDCREREKRVAENKARRLGVGVASEGSSENQSPMVQFRNLSPTPRPSSSLAVRRSPSPLPPSFHHTTASRKPALPPANILSSPRHIHHPLPARQLRISLHAVYCLRVKYPLRIEVTLFGTTYACQQRGGYRVVASAAEDAAATNSATPSDTFTTTAGSRISIFDNDMIIPLTRSQEEQLPTSIVLVVKEDLHATTASANGTSGRPGHQRRNSGLHQRRASQDRSNTTSPAPPSITTATAAATTTTSSSQSTVAEGTSSGAPHRQSWSVTVNISEIQNETQSSGNDGTTSSSSSTLSSVHVVEGTFDLHQNNCGSNGASPKLSPYISMAVRYE